MDLSLTSANQREYAPLNPIKTIPAWCFCGTSTRDSYTPRRVCSNVLTALDEAQGPWILKLQVSPGTRVGTTGWLRDPQLVGSAAPVYARDALAKFQRIAALIVIDFWDAPQVVRQYLEQGLDPVRVLAERASWSAWNRSKDEREREAIMAAIKSTWIDGPWSAHQHTLEAAAWTKEAFTNPRQNRSMRLQLERELLRCLEAVPGLQGASHA